MSRFDQLPALLKGSLAPLWLVTGEEPLLMLEAADAIRQAAREQGYTEREVYNASGVWDWSLLLDGCRSMGLFDERKIIEVRLATCRPGTKGADALSQLAQMPLQDTIVVVSMPSDWSVKKLAWFKKLSAAAQVVECLPVTAKELPHWFEQRLARQRQTADAEALRLLSERCEGNLLAAKQEILKLAYQHPGDVHITADMIRDAVSDVSRFDAENLLEAMMFGDAGKAARIVSSLKAEGVGIPSFSWMLADEIRAAARVRALMDKGQPRDAAMRAVGAFGPRQTRISAVVRRHKAQRLGNALMLCADIDRLAKGLTVKDRDSDPWLEVLSLVTFIAR
jgi:DNA polymerase-3 subunit delta